MAVLNTARLVRFANFAPVARSLRSPRGGWVTSFLFPHSSLLTPHSSLLRPHASLHPVIPGLTRNLPSSDCPYFAPCTSWRMGVPCHCACADAVRSRSIQGFGPGSLDSLVHALDGRERFRFKPGMTELGGAVTPGMTGGCGITRPPCQVGARRAVPMRVRRCCA